MTDYINDYISKQTAQEVVKEAIRVVSVYPYDKLPSEEAIDIFEKSMKYIAEAPAADVRENVKGEWILGEIETGAFNVQYQWKRCSECGWKSSLVIPRNFCPNCGADMRDKLPNGEGKE